MTAYDRKMQELLKERDDARVEIVVLHSLLKTQGAILGKLGSCPSEQRVSELEMEVAMLRDEKDAAYRRGAEAMREAAARTSDKIAIGQFDAERIAINDVTEAIRGLPIPEDKQ